MLRNVVVFIFYMVNTTKLIYIATYVNCIFTIAYYTCPFKDTLLFFLFFVCRYLSLVEVLTSYIDSRLCSAVVVCWCIILLYFLNVWYFFDLIVLYIYCIMVCICAFIGFVWICIWCYFGTDALYTGRYFLSYLI